MRYGSKLLLCVMFVFSFALSSADITFFEGDEGSDFIVIEEGNVDETAVYCGNAICDSGETCSSCKVDCGSCSGWGGRRTFPVEVADDDIVDVEVEHPYVGDLEVESYSFILGAGIAMSIIVVNAAVLIMFFVHRKKKVVHRKKRVVHRRKKK